MRKRLKIASAAVLLGFFGVVAWQLRRLQEPVHQRRRLSRWLGEAVDDFLGHPADPSEKLAC